MADDERVDGRDLIERDEPGSDALLLRGLILKLAAIYRAINSDDKDHAKIAAIRKALEERQ